MGALLLTSAGFKNPRIGAEFLRLVARPADCARVLMIPTAAITDEQWKYVEISEAELLGMGIQKENIVQIPPGEPVYYDPMKDFHALYVCGGDTEHLLKEIMKTGFDKRIREFLDEGGVYVGVSAGSIVAGPRVGNQEGLKFVDTIIVPHYSDENAERRARVEMLRAETSDPVVPLTDNQALLIREGQPLIIE